ncbi:hypothetical protein PUNSTDRAFT_136999 [Punctularia strigosozonata HHB-11173 SS5]|uniref:uncharacterized protein n=1 Tax=Punctularia strigosozonata (strain HHB-11173) TaxID=741275 RepID=UPI0004416772|nr:uncharacterized protein PUNSTDRAFT_136999 [Punctularia strigosozonata HHB-11173 SS5]EIN06211.1 hypothetical protein PUNSTDRAFT_136999 [Punctularia strigosozonata HHB-11173 SS5]
MFSTRRTLAILLILAFGLVAVQASPSGTFSSNADRLKRGLPPAKPARLFGSRTDSERRSIPSTTPGYTYTSPIAIWPSGSLPSRKRDGVPLGYLGAYGVTNLASAWTFTYTEPEIATNVVQLPHPGTPYRLSGVAIRSGSQVTLGPGNTIYLELQNTRASTPAGSTTPTYVYDTYAIGYAQTTIFSVDPATGKVTVKWVNPDGSTPTTYLAVSGTGIYVTGDVSALQSQLGSSATLTLVDIYLSA